MSAYGSRSQKFINYLPNGEGRDQYISTINGGFYPNESGFRFKQESRTLKKTYCKSTPRLDAKTLKYTFDGSGRDSYVGHNYGGLISNQSKFSFYTSLRAPTPSTPSKTSNRKLASSQTQLIKRLTMPKRIYW